jgi:hypothetical protein
MPLVTDERQLVKQQKERKETDVDHGPALTRGGLQPSERDAAADRPETKRVRDCDFK